MPTYKEQFDKITVDYIAGKIKPYNWGFCFCGTLCDYDEQWNWQKHDFYSAKDLALMEKALLNTIASQTFYPEHDNSVTKYSDCTKHPNFENALFNGMVAALEVLKSIHESKGEQVDELVFRKRELVAI